MGRTGSPKLQPQNIVTTPSPQQIIKPSPTLIDETSDWKTYTTSKFTFKYPLGSRVEEREKDFLVIVPSEKKTLAPQEGISIDARLSGDNASFNQAVNSTKQGLTNIKQENIVNGIKISGVMGPGMGEGLPAISVLLQYKNGAIVVSPDQTVQPKLLDQILQTFRFLDEKETQIISESKTSPDGSYIISEEFLADYNKIIVKDNRGNTIVSDLVAVNEKEIGYNIKFKCQCGTYFKGWVSDETFAIEIVNGGGEEYEYLVDAKSGKVDELTFRKIK